MKTNYIILVFKDLGEEFIVKHLCCYENKPNKMDVDSLLKELAEDEEFGMVGDTDYEVMVLERGIEEHDYLIAELDIPEEINEDFEDDDTTITRHG